QLQGTVGGGHHARTSDRGVEGRHHRPTCRQCRQHRQTRNHRLVYVQHVELAGLKPTTYACRRDRSERQSGHRPVVAHRHRPPRRQHVGRQVGVVVGGGQHAHFMPQVDQHPRQVLYMVLYPAGHVQRVWADQSDPHSYPDSTTEPPSAGTRCSATEGSHSRCSMCQSCGCSAIPAASRSATAWVSACTCSARLSPGGTGNGPCSCAPTASGSYHIDKAYSGAPVRRANSAGPAGIRVRAPKNSTSTPRLDRSRSASNGTIRPCLSRSSRISNGGRSPPRSGMISNPIDSRKATNRRKSPSGRNRSATVVTSQPFEAAQAPAASQLAAWGRAITTPRPAATVSMSSCSPSSRKQVRTRCGDQDGSRNASIQYRA